MVDWMSPEELTRDTVAFHNLIHALLGVYVWEWATSFEFDWQYLTRRKRFRWPLVFYFLNRYSLLLALIGVVVALNVKSKMNCQALYMFNSLVGNAAIGFASINLSLRTIVVWHSKIYIVGPIVLIIIGHWSLLLHGTLMDAKFVPGVGCVITKTNNTVLASAFIYTMCFDCVVLLLTAYKLLHSVKHGQSRVVSMLFHDGLVYFCIAVLANTLATIFMLLNLNAIMSIIANIPSAVASTIVACRCVRRLSMHNEPSSPNVFSTLRIRTFFSDSQRATSGGLSLTTYQSSQLSQANLPDSLGPPDSDLDIKESARTSKTAYVEEVERIELGEAMSRKDDAVTVDDRSEIGLEAMHEEGRGRKRSGPYS